MSYLLKSHIYIFAVIFFILLIMPLTVFGAGLITCNGVDCDLDDLINLFTKVIDWLAIVIVPSLAGIAFMVAGFLYITSVGDPNRISRAHTMFRNTFLGIVIALSAWLIIKTLLVSFGVTGGFNLFS